MRNRFLTTAVVASFIGLAGFSGLGCDAASPSSPPPPPPQPEVLRVTAVSPNIGSTVGNQVVRISGTGFKTGATVSLGANAISVTVVSSTSIVATIRDHAAATVDVVVTNPGGETATLAGGFTFEVDAPYTVTPSATTVNAGAELKVSWTGPRGRAADWIGLFKLGAPNENYGWWSYTFGASSGTFTLSAPTEAGQYEFRYLLDDGYVDTARSTTVTVR